MLTGRTLLLGVSGGIAAYKACELVRMLIREGAEVRVVMTPHATEFVTPLTFTALTNQTALVNEFPQADHQPVEDVYAHLNLTRGLDAYVIVPATANTLAKLVAGQADNLVTASYLSCEAPVIIAPAMNSRMWNHAATQHNVAILSERGHQVVKPGEGELACGDTGAGRLADLPDVFSAIAAAVLAQPDVKLSAGPLSGKRFVVTAGGTREYLDPVRFITNSSSGKLGLEITRALLESGSQVELIETGIAIPPELEVRLANRQTVRTAFDLELALTQRIEQADGLVMLAAVADYGPAQYENSKHKKDGSAWQLELAETTDILAQVTGRRKPGQVFVGVSLEDTHWLERGQAKATSKAVDLNIAVELGADLPFGDQRLNCALVTPEEIIAPGAQRTKREAAQLVTTWLAEWFTATGA